MQETLEDIDKNSDGHVDEDEYIGKCINWNELGQINKDWQCVIQCKKEKTVW